MTSTILHGLNRLLVKAQAPGGEHADPTNNDFIQCLDYEALEKHFDIHKYYPKYIHNYDYLTPTIKSLIADKPIYAKANRHVKNWKNPGTRKTLITTIDLDTGEAEIVEKSPKRKQRRDLIREQRQERRELRLEQREARHQMRNSAQESAKEFRQERRDLIKDHLQEKRDLHRDHLQELHAVKRKPNYICHPHQKTELADKPTKSESTSKESLHSPDHKQTVFRNPFDSQSTLVQSTGPTSVSMTAANSDDYTHRTRQNSVMSTGLEGPQRRPSLASKLFNIVKGERKKEDLENLKTSSSYDATKSTMTNTRSKKNNFIRLKLQDRQTRRGSEQFGTYKRDERGNS